MMKSLFKPSAWKILKLFYENKNKQIHLREIARRTGLNESTISCHLTNLVKSGILRKEDDANLKKFYVCDVSEIFPLFDSEKLNSLSSKDKKGIKEYLAGLETKPVILLISIDNNKIEMISIDNSVNGKDPRNPGRVKVKEGGNGIKFKITKINEKELKKEVNSKKEVFPVFNAKYFYEVINE